LADRILLVNTEKIAVNLCPRQLLFSSCRGHRQRQRGSGIHQTQPDKKVTTANQELENMAEHIEDLTVNYEEDGVQLVKETDKEILSKGAWATILFKYQDYDKKNQEYGAEKFTIRRYQKRNGQYQAKSKFNISSAAQARKLINTLERWTQKD
jgi:hypothetical protein